MTTARATGGSGIVFGNSRIPLHFVRLWKAAKMFVEVGDRGQGSLYAGESPVFRVDSIDCILNRTDVHSGGSLLLTDSFALAGRVRV